MEGSMGEIQLRTGDLLSELVIRVIGLPGAQGSKTLTRYGSLIESSKKVQPWRQDIRHAALDAYKKDPIDCAVSVSIEFIFPRPKGHFGTGRNKDKLKPSAPQFLTSHASGDIDKLCRSTLDGLSVTSGGTVLKDDSLVISLSAHKRYSKGEELPGAIISILPVFITT